MNYWLVKTEEDVYPIDQLKQDVETLWDGVRNFQARNYLTSMEKGDQIFIYHSNAEIPGITGLASISKTAVPDPLQFLKDSDYFDKRATKEKPLWFSPTLKFKAKFKNKISLEDLRNIKELKDSPLLRKGNRLSVMPINETEAKVLLSKK
jgi:predicted RNA-binding protein with PUA-like domain